MKKITVKVRGGAVSSLVVHAGRNSMRGRRVLNRKSHCQAKRKEQGGDHNATRTCLRKKKGSSREARGKGA